MVEMRWDERLLATEPGREPVGIDGERVARVLFQQSSRLLYVPDQFRIGIAELVRERLSEQCLAPRRSIAVEDEGLLREKCVGLALRTRR